MQERHVEEFIRSFPGNHVQTYVRLQNTPRHRSLGISSLSELPSDIKRSGYENDDRTPA
jgi:hypothetical protein